MAKEIKFENGKTIKIPGTDNPDIRQYFDIVELGEINWELVYLAAPYSSFNPKSQKNRAAIIGQVAKRLTVEKGLNIHDPVNYGLILENNGGEPSQGWYIFGLLYLLKCDRLIVLTPPGWQESFGVQEEIRLAKKLGLPIAYIDSESLDRKDIKLIWNQTKVENILSK